MSPSPCVVWFRQDLRLADNPALNAAVERGAPIIPLFIWSPEEEGAWRLGDPARWWLRASLETLSEELDARGSKLICRKGPAREALQQIVEETGADAIFWNRRYNPSAIERDAGLAATLRKSKLTVDTFHGSLLIDPDLLLNKRGEPFKVFTPFWNAATRQFAVHTPLPAPKELPAPDSWPRRPTLNELMLSAEPAHDLGTHWRPGADGAHAALGYFLEHGLPTYREGRDRMDQEGTSRLSPHLRFGEISPGEIVHAVNGWLQGESNGMAREAETFIRQLYWREFGYYLLYHFPHMLDEPLQERFEAFPWEDDQEALEMWQSGMTGYPIVDAAMRQMHAIGWMHNRGRMIAGSFLVKDLLIDWRKGMRWFWDNLVDADLQNNTLGWQWVSGCGADAAPYFRIFNPVKQGQTHDPNGDYVRQWVPELAALPTAYIHAPWEAPDAVLAEAELRLGEDYPMPIVDHQKARALALAAYNEIKQTD